MYHYRLDDLTDYRLVCLLTGESCCGCTAIHSCRFGSLEPRAVGADLESLLIKWQEQDLREILRQGFYHSGKLPDDASKTVYGWEDALERFPNDVEYLTAAEAMEQVRRTRKYMRGVPFEKQWTERRAKACAGQEGPVARRAAMTDTLWRWYLQDNKITMAQLRHVFEVGLVEERYRNSKDPQEKETLHLRLEELIRRGA